MKTIKISRRRWGRGEKGGSLHDPRTHLQCCLGFVCRAYGVPLNAIKGLGYPEAVANRLRNRLPRWLREGAVDVDRAVEINDNGSLSSAERERQLRPIFRRHRLRVVFTK